MIRLGRSAAVVGLGLAIAAAVGCGVGAGAMKAESKSAVSPCGTATLPAWSPDGTQIAWYGHRWPLPKLHHRGAGYTVLRAMCVSDADGKHLHRLPHTGCSEHCSGPLSEGLDQLYWRGAGLLYGNDLGIFTIPPGQKPKLLGKKPSLVHGC